MTDFQKNGNKKKTCLPQGEIVVNYGANIEEGGFRASDSQRKDRGQEGHRKTAHMVLDELK